MSNSRLKGYATMALLGAALAGAGSANGMPKNYFSTPERESDPKRVADIKSAAEAKRERKRQKRLLLCKVQ